MRVGSRRRLRSPHGRQRIRRERPSAATRPCRRNCRRRSRKRRVRTPRLPPCMPRFAANRHNSRAGRSPPACRLCPHPPWQWQDATPAAFRAAPGFRRAGHRATRVEPACTIARAFRPALILGACTRRAFRRPRRSSGRRSRSRTGACRARSSTQRAPRTCPTPRAPPPPLPRSPGKTRNCATARRNRRPPSLAAARARGAVARCATAGHASLGAVCRQCVDARARQARSAALSRSARRIRRRQASMRWLPRRRPACGCASRSRLRPTDGRCAGHRALTRTWDAGRASQRAAWTGVALVAAIVVAMAVLAVPLRDASHAPAPTSRTIVPCSPLPVRAPPKTSRCRARRRRSPLPTRARPSIAC